MSHLPPWVKASSLRDAAPHYVFEPAHESRVGYAREPAEAARWLTALLRGMIDLPEGKIA